MKKSIILFFILAALLIGCMPHKEPADITENMEKKPDVSITEATEAVETAKDTQLTGYEGYDYIIRKYVTAMTDNWTWEQFQQNDISPNILLDDTTILNSLGWCLLDLDQNGIEELVISDGVHLFDLYVMQPHNGEPGHLISAYPDSYQLCENGIIQCQEYYSGTTMWRWYQFSENDVHQVELVFFDGQTDEYSYGTDGTDGHRLTPISEEEWQAVMAKHRTADLPLTPFVAPEFFDSPEAE